MPRDARTMKTRGMQDREMASNIIHPLRAYRNISLPKQEKLFVDQITIESIGFLARFCCMFSHSNG